MSGIQTELSAAMLYRIWKEQSNLDEAYCWHRSTRRNIISRRHYQTVKLGVYPCVVVLQAFFETKGKGNDLDDMECLR